MAKTASAKTERATRTITKPKTLSSSLGAPSQHTQGSRKGKRAWRKNVDLQDVEEALEGLRAEERITGSTLQSKTNQELFQVDVKGDDAVRKALPRFSTKALMSAQLLAQRSAVPAVTSRTFTTPSDSKKRKLSHEEKARLLRTAKKLRKGPLNSYVDPTELGAGSATIDVSEAVKNSGGYNVWETKEESNDVEEEIPRPSSNAKPKAPPPTVHTHPRRVIELPAIAEPHQGVSYNPALTAHQELLRKAHEIEERRQQEAQKNEEWNARLQKIRNLNAEVQEGVPAGMTVEDVEANDDQSEEDTTEVPAPKKVPARKTKKDRARAAKLREEKRALAEKTAKKRLLASITMARSLRASVDSTRSASQQAREQREKARQERLRRGLAGHKVGKHVVREGEVEVQLGEELSESFRALKPEGNLFRDRFLSLQHRGLVEPTAQQNGKKRVAKTKEYEKHPYKRFDREN
ncbi:P60-like protein [Punctularia strigosozonata HHB-11173 SS5]|uniref:P60-like protein n=1 Tax=Punctularia strigosozonata (strain HHB-11173) TaxID=741275 RepID=UPI000441726C|nr:P60-like protein [Punctularia strigosozonata HHB-11173 SS5]EIN14662.1 P60-like protein [Punctularia strigosozonata HHB-11173 SS5]